MSDNIIQFPGITTADLPPNQVLEAALNADLDHVLVLGRQKDGKYYFAGSSADLTANNWICDRFKFKSQVMDDEAEV